MKPLKYIFAALIFVLLAGSAFAATVDTSCDDERNEYVNQRLALCSVHAYNIGDVSNPESADRRAQMEEVIALKTTVMTQQIKKQYDFLEATIGRIKTQLEKAVLVAKLEAAGAPSSESNSSSNKSQSNYLTCGMKSRSDTIQCVRQNISGIYAELSSRGPNGGVQTAVRKQLNTDANNINAFSGATTFTKINSCDDAKITSVQTAQSCLQDINGALDSLENATRQSQQRNAMGAYGGIGY